MKAFKSWFTKQKGDEEPEEEDCPNCGKKPVCPDCGQCYDPNCNAGCIYCRSIRQANKRKKW